MESIVPDIVFILLWWLVMTRYFFQLSVPYHEINNLALGDSQLAINNESAYLAVISALFSIIIELIISKRYFNFKTYHQKVFAKTLSYTSLIILVLAISSKFEYLNLIAIKSKMSYGLRYFLLGSYILAVIVIPMNVIRDISSMLGFKMFIAKVFGYYYTPKEENRIFLFLDLANSTKIAEILGHVEFSKLIKELVKDMSHFIKKHKGTVYQYVGDEVILSWNSNNNSNLERCIRMYFDFQKALECKNEIYSKRFNIQPKFRASINMGKVTVVEIGVTKKDIVYHGDVLNTAARVQKLCKKYDKDILACEEFVRNMNPLDDYFIDPIDQIALEGKTKKEIIFSVEKYINC